MASHQQDNASEWMAYTLLRRLWDVLAAQDMPVALRHFLQEAKVAMGAKRVFLVTFREEVVADFLVLEHNAWRDDSDSIQGAWRTFWFLLDEPPHMSEGVPPHDIHAPNGLEKTLPNGETAFAAVIGARGLLVMILDDDAPLSASKRRLWLEVGQALSVLSARLDQERQLQAWVNQLANRLEDQETTLKQERRTLRAILDNANLGVVYLENFIIQQVNRHLCHSLGYEPADLIGRSFRFIRVSQDERDPSDVVGMILGQRLNYENAAKLRAKDGTIRHVDLTLILVSQPNEPHTRMVGLVRDLSELYGIRQERDRFIDNAAHELRTPLARLSLRLQLLRRKPEQLDTNLKELDDIFLQMRQLVDNLLTLTRHESGRITPQAKPLILQDVVYGVVDGYQGLLKQRNLSFDFQWPSTPLELHTDEALLKQALDHLIKYMIAHTESGTGLYSVISIHRELDTRFVRLEMVYTGRAIEESLLPNAVFEPFIEAKTSTIPTLTGMELAICQRIVQGLNGQIRASNRPATSGCMFSLYFLLNPELSA